MSQKSWDKSGHMFGFEWAHQLEESILKNMDRISCMEIIPENFFDGRFQYFLEQLKQNKVPVAVHGVMLSIGSMEELKEDHLNKMLEVAAQVDMVNFSEHLSLTEIGGIDLDALTPLDWTEEVVEHVCRKIDRIQSKLKVPFLIENVTNRFIVPDADYSETEFINRVLELTGCNLLLDVTNVFTNATNFQYDPFEWLDQINMKAVGLVHLAGGHFESDGFLMDSHDNTIPEPVWDLYRKVCQQAPPFMTIIERTGNFPKFEDLVAELDKARRIVGETEAFYRVDSSKIESYTSPRI